MNDATDWLELVRPDRPDPDAQPTAAQAAALAAEPSLRAELARRTRFDEAAAAAVQAVPVPADLVARLSSAGIARKRSAALPRRAFAAACAAAVLAAGLWWRFGPDRSWTPERVAQAVLAYHAGALSFTPEPLADARNRLPDRFDPDTLAAGGWGTVLGRDAYLLTLRRGEHTATLAALGARVFPASFDFDAQVSGDAETVFLNLGGTVYVAVAQDLRRFERPSTIL